MRVKTFVLLLALSCLFLARTTVFAEDAEDDEEVYDEEEDEDEEVDDEEDEVEEDEEFEDEDEDDDILSASTDVQTVYMFLEAPEERLTIGTNLTLLLGFANKGDSQTFNADKLVVSLHSPYDYNYYITNFTVKELNGTTIGPNSEVSLVFRFGLAGFEAMEYHMSAYIDYNSTDDTMYRSTFLNKTIEFIEPVSSFDVKQFFLIVLGICALGLLGYYLFEQFAPQTGKGGGQKKKGKSNKGQERGTSDLNEEIDDYDAWAAPMYKPKARSKVKRSRSSLTGKKKKKKKKPSSKQKKKK